MGVPIFPEIETLKTRDGIALKSYVRILRDDKYYLIHNYREYFGDTNLEVLNYTRRFIKDCYNCLILYEINDFTTVDGFTLNPLDNNQEPEKDRLLKIINQSH